MKDPLHGVTLENILTYLEKEHGWEELYNRIKINCFAKDPSIKSSLNFLRKTPWARKKVEDLYVHLISRSPQTIKDKSKENLNARPGRKD